MDFRIFVDAQFVVSVHIQIIAGVRLPEDQVEHFQERFHVHESLAFHVIQFREIIHDFGATDLIHVAISESIPQMVFPNAVLFQFRFVGTILAAFRTEFFEHFLDCAAGRLWFRCAFNPQSSDRCFPCSNRFASGFQFVSMLVFAFLSDDGLPIDHDTETVFPESIFLLIDTRTFQLWHVQHP